MPSRGGTGGLTNVVHKVLQEHDEITGIEDQGEAKTVPALLDILWRVLPPAVAV